MLQTESPFAGDQSRALPFPTKQAHTSKRPSFTALLASSVGEHLGHVPATPCPRIHAIGGVLQKGNTTATKQLGLTHELEAAILREADVNLRVSASKVFVSRVVCFEAPLV